MRTFFGIVIILLASSAFWLTYLWCTTRKDDDTVKRQSTKDNPKNNESGPIKNINQPLDRA